MELVYREALTEIKKGNQCVIATVTRTKGSTPQKPGAKLLVRNDGSGAGTLGGGCVEGDIWFSAKMLLQDGGPSAITEYELNEDIAARDGLECGGTMYFLMDPVRETDQDNATAITEEVLAAYEGGAPVALAVLVGIPKNSDQKIGSKVLIRENGTIMGSLGSETLDAVAQEKAAPLLAYGRDEYVTTEDGHSIYVEAYTTPPKLILMGGGHVNKAIAPLAKTVGFRVYVVDDRPEFANPERFPEAEATIAKDFVEGLGDIPVNPNTFIVIGTRGHREDDMCLEAAARTNAGYVGLLGSKRKVILIYEELLKHGIPTERIRSLRAPIGLDIRARTPEEIAVSVVAELVQARLGGEGKPMKLEERRITKILDKLAKAREKAATIANDAQWSLPKI